MAAGRSSGVGRSPMVHVGGMCAALVPAEQCCRRAPLCSHPLLQPAGYCDGGVHGTGLVSSGRWRWGWGVRWRRAWCPCCRGCTWWGRRYGCMSCTGWTGDLPMMLLKHCPATAPAKNCCNQQRSSLQPAGIYSNPASVVLQVTGYRINPRGATHKEPTRGAHGVTTQTVASGSQDRNASESSSAPSSAPSSAE